jgi:hypothetical protein
MAEELSTVAVSSYERALILGDLAGLKQDERLNYYKAVCESVGLNPLTKPFDYITLNGKMVLYATRACTDQLRKIHGVSVLELKKEWQEGVLSVVCKVSDKSGRTDVATGALMVLNLKGNDLANALMKAETKAKRRATLSICGLGVLDETEIETIPYSVLDRAGESTTAAPAFIPQPTVAPAVNQQAAPYQQPMQPPVNIPGFITAPVPDMSELSTGGMTVIGGMMGSIVHIEEPPPEAPFPNMEPLNAVTRAQTYENGIKSGELTVTDVRKAEGLPSIASVQNADALISRPELDKFLARAAKIVRDKLPKGGLKDAEASSGVKNYLLKSSGKSGFRFISATVFETLLTALEAGTPENAAAIVKAAK